VLSRGLLSGHWSSGRALAPGDFRGSAPRFSRENLDRNLLLVEGLRSVAEAKGATVAQVAIGWALSRGPDIVALVGARKRDRLTEALGALDLDLTVHDLAAIERAVPADAAAGERYDARQMAMLDSERGRTGARVSEGRPSRSLGRRGGPGRPCCPQRLLGCRWTRHGPRIDRGAGRAHGQRTPSHRAVFPWPGRSAHRGMPRQP